MLRFWSGTSSRYVPLFNLRVIVCGWGSIFIKEFMKNIVLITAVSIFLCACQASGPIFENTVEIPESKAVVYVYRPSQLFNFGGWPNIYVDGNKVFSLKNGGYGVLNIDSGSHEIKAQGSMLLTNWYPGPQSVSLMFDQGGEYFIRVTPQMTDMMVVGSVGVAAGRAHMVVVSKDQALLEISETKKIIETEI